MLTSFCATEARECGRRVFSWLLIHLPVMKKMSHVWCLGWCTAASVSINLKSKGMYVAALALRPGDDLQFFFWSYQGSSFQDKLPNLSPPPVQDDVVPPANEKYNIQFFTGFTGSWKLTRRIAGEFLEKITQISVVPKVPCFFISYHIGQRNRAVGREYESGVEILSPLSKSQNHSNFFKIAIRDSFWARGKTSSRRAKTWWWAFLFNLLREHIMHSCTSIRKNARSSRK